MSDDVNSDPVIEVNNGGAGPASVLPGISDRLSEMDMLGLERASTKVELAKAKAERAVAEAESEELRYKNSVMTLFMKYGLSDRDSIAQDGTFVRNGQK